MSLKPSRIALAMFALLVALPAAAFADIDRWYVIRFGEDRAGWMHFQEIDTTIGFRTISEVHIEVARGDLTIAVDLKTEFYETYDGQPYELTNMQKLGAEPITSTYRWEPNGIKATINQGGRSTIETLDHIKGEWLTPAAARRFVAQKLKEGAKTFEYRTIDATNGPSPMRVSGTVIGEEIVEAVGKRVPAIAVRTEQSVAPGISSTEYLTEDALAVITEFGIGPIDMTVSLSERELALAKIEPTEILVSTLIKPNRSIANPRETRSATYVLSVPDGELPDLPQTSAQRVERLSPQQARVTVDLAGEEYEDRSVLTDPRYRNGPAMLDWRNKLVMSLAERAINKNYRMPRAEMAERMRRFVHGYITEKGLQVGFASATETARTAEGDCTEHATLLAAMMRAVGIPSRVVGGLIYAEEFAGRSRIFGYHMWTQALIEDDKGEWRWVDYDATLPGATAFDATHIAVTLSSMADDEMINSMAALAPLLGRLEIDVESIDDAAKGAAR